MRILTWILLLALLATSQMSHADKSTFIQSPARIALGQTREFDLGKLPRANTVLLKISSRLDSKGLGGSMFFMRLRLNGHEIEPAKSRLAVRMVNKPMNSPVSAGIPGDWYNSKLGGWRVIYAPDFTLALRQTFYADNPYEIVLDVTDLIIPEADNKLEITNTAKDIVKKYTGKNGGLVIGELSVETSTPPSLMMQSAPNFPPLINHGEPAAGAASYRGKILPGGGFAIQTGKSTFKFNSAFSYPNAGFHVLSADTHNDKNDWQLKVDKNAGRVIALCSDYRIERTIKFTKTHVEIADAITNLHHDAPLGMAVRDEMDLSGLSAPQIRLAGNPDPAVNDYYAPGNPSVHVRLPDSAIGIIAEDDVFRNQARLYVNPAGKSTFAVAGIRTEMLRLAPSETYTLRWAVYPVAGPDYYDFINLVRDDWKSNFTVLGGWWWNYPPDAVLEMPLPQLRDFLVKNGIHYATIGGGWLDLLQDKHRIGFGAGVFDDYWSDYRRRIRESADKLREALPGIKVMAYYDTQRDSSENSQEKFADSALTGANGKQLYTDWNGRYSRSYTMAPTLQNSFGKAMLNVARRYFDDLKLDGIYWDEMESVGYGTPLLSYTTNFDGHSCLLDPETWTIQREVGVAALSGLPFRMAVIKIIQQHNGVLLGNMPAGMLSELHTGAQRMVEIQHNDTWGYLENLGTPLGYISANIDWANFLRAFHQAVLPVSQLTAEGFPHDITPYLFPFTPIELHAGYLLGKERIIVTHDGNYGWQNNFSLAISRHFDGKGKLTGDHFATQISSKGARTKVLLGENEAAVLEKIPVHFAPASKVLLPDWQASITVTEYDEKQLSSKIDAPQGGILTVSNGLFPIQNGRTVNIFSQQKNANSGLAKHITVQNGTLAVDISKGFEGTYTIKLTQ